MIVEPYQPAWADEFRELSEILKHHLGSLALRVHHVGSTAIPGMPAKSILDINVEIAADILLNDVSNRLAELGYIFQDDLGIPDRYAFERRDDSTPLKLPRRQWQNHHLYVCPTFSKELRRQLHFRDALVASPELRDEYRRIKEQAVKAAGNERRIYTVTKEKLGAEFFARVLALEPIAQRINRAHDLLENEEQKLADGQIDEPTWHRNIAAAITPAYLAADNPRSQSGNSGDDAKWKHTRGLIADGIDRDGTFLDVGCASGYLMECMQRWCAEKGLALEPYGLDIAPELADLARRRLPHWSNRIYTGNAMEWRPPRRFNFVRTGLEYVPRLRRRDFISRHLDQFVAPGGRLIISTFGEARASIAEPLTEQLVASWGFHVAGRSERSHADSRICYRVIWIDRA